MNFRAGIVFLREFARSLVVVKWMTRHFFTASKKMPLSNNPAEKPFSDVVQLGAVITKTDGGFHVGFLYKFGSSAPEMLHLAWHHILRRDVPSDRYSWVQCGFSEDIRDVIVPALAGVAQDQKIPYSPIFQGIYFDQGVLTYSRNQAGDGLTCATFMMALMQTLGCPLFNPDEWPVRDDDSTWHEGVIAALEAEPTVTQQHTDAIRATPKGARFRPQEVAGSFSELGAPIPFSQAEALGREVATEVCAVSQTTT